MPKRNEDENHQNKETTIEEKDVLSTDEAFFSFIPEATRIEVCFLEDTTQSYVLTCTFHKCNVDENFKKEMRLKIPKSLMIFLSFLGVSSF